MTRSSRSLVVCGVVLVVGILGCVAPGRAQEAADDLTLGTASLRRTAERVSVLLKEVPDRCSQQVQIVPVDGLADYMRSVTAQYWPVEVMIVQTTLLAVDRVAADPGIDGTTLLKAKLQETTGMAPAELDKLHAPKVAWSDVVMGLCLANATGKKPEELLAQFKGGKTWPDVAEAAGLNAGKLMEESRKVLKGK